MFKTWQAEPPGAAIQAQLVEGPGSPRTLLRGASVLGVFVSSWVGAKLAVAERTSAGYRSGVRSAVDSGAVDWDEAFCYFGSLSPDGRWLACYREGQVYLRSLADRGVVRQVSTDGGIEPRWSPVGNLLFFRRSSRWLATSVSFEPEPRWDPPRVVFETDFVDTDGYSYDVSADGQYLYLVKPAAPDERRKIHFVTGWSEELERLVTVAR